MMPAKEEPVDRFDDLAEDFAALASGTRLRLLHLLTRPCYGEEIAEALGTSRQGAARHVERLVERGFLRSLNGWRPTGPVVEYQVAPQRLFALGVALGDLARLEPSGGPPRRIDRTVVLERGGTPEPADAAPAHGQLLVLTGASAGARLVLEGSARWSIGRDPACELSLKNDPFVSARHADVEATESGVDVVDAYSANGTHVNLGRVPRGARVPLQPGDVLGVGHTLVVYQRAGPHP